MLHDKHWTSKSTTTTTYWASFMKHKWANVPILAYLGRCNAADLRPWSLWLQPRAYKLDQAHFNNTINTHSDNMFGIRRQPPVLVLHCVLTRGATLGHKSPLGHSLPFSFIFFSASVSSRTNEPPQNTITVSLSGPSPSFSLSVSFSWSGKSLTNLFSFSDTPQTHNILEMSWCISWFHFDRVSLFPPEYEYK